ncbi:MAG: hypothetical protein HYX27_08450 [Acidobacteria bacterium]|nr:hypothetical protein [Acidobacteriota bacterium]
MICRFLTGVVTNKMMRSVLLFFCFVAAVYAEAYLVHDGMVVARFSLPPKWDVEVSGTRAFAFNYPPAQGRGKGSLPLGGIELTFEVYDLNNRNRGAIATKAILRSMRGGGPKDNVRIRNRFEASKDCHLLEVFFDRQREPGTANDVAFLVLECRTAVIVVWIYADSAVDSGKIIDEATRMLLETSVSSTR